MTDPGAKPAHRSDSPSRMPWVLASYVAAFLAFTASGRLNVSAGLPQS